MSCVILAHVEVGQITGMGAYRVVEAMLFVQRVVVFAGRSERRSGAVPFIVDVDAVQARRHAARVDVDADQATDVLG